MSKKRPLKSTADCQKAIASYDKERYDEALKAIRNCKSVYAKSFIYHHAEGFLHYKLASSSSDLDEIYKSLKDAAASARQAWMLCRNCIFLAHFRASMLYLLSGINQDYDRVIEECRKALAIKEPYYPERDLFVFIDVDKKMDVKKINRELNALIKHCQLKKCWVLVNSNIRYEKYMKEIEDRVKEANNRIKSLSHSPGMRSESVSLLQTVEDRGKKQASDSEIAEMNSDGGQNLFKVSIKDLEKHLQSLKEHMEMDLVMEAIEFFKRWKTWEFWECFPCCIKFADWESYKEHLANVHNWQIPLSILSFLPTDVDNFSVEMIVKGDWKPVDIDAVLKSTSRTILFGSETDEKLPSLASTGEQKWPFCDDCERTKHLETVRDMLRSLLKHKCLMQYNVEKVIEITFEALKDIIPQRLRTRDQQTLKLVCFLGSSQFETIFNYLRLLSDVFISRENTEMENSMDEQLINDQGLDIKEKLILSGDLSFLLLDASGKNLSLLSFSAEEVGKALESWKSTRNSQSRLVDDLHLLIKAELSRLEVMYGERRLHVRKFKAIEEVGNVCKVWGQPPGNAVRVYEARLKKLKRDLVLQFREGNYKTEKPSDLEMNLKLDFISHILRIDEIQNTYKFEYWDLSDDALRIRMVGWSAHISGEIHVDNAVMKHIVDVMRQYSLPLGRVSACDYRSIMLPVLKSFIQETQTIGQPLLPPQAADQM